MPVKKIPNTLNCEARAGEAVMSVFTNSKKAHFTCSEAKLFEILEYSINDTQGYFQVHLTTHPFIAVHVTGTDDKLKLHGPELRKNIVNALSEYHDIGKVKI